MYNHQYLTENDEAYVAQYDGSRINVSNFERVASVALGTLLIYNAIRKLGKRPLRSISRIAAGGALFYRGVTGFCPVYNKFEIDGTRTQSVNIRSTFIINKPKHEVYQFWRRLENLPLFMRHIVSVKEIDSRRSHWEAKIPEKNPLTIRWDAEIVKDEEGSLLSWQSLPGSTIDNAGKVEFRNALGDMGTEVRIMITYRPPAGNIGTGIARLFNPMFEKMVKEDVNNFKSYMDAGSIASASATTDSPSVHHASM